MILYFRYQHTVQSVVLLQRHVRGMLLTRHLHQCYLLQRWAAVTMQATYRGLKQRREYLKMRRDIVKAQAVCRGYLARKEAEHRRTAVKTLQKAVKRWIACKKVLYCVLL